LTTDQLERAIWSRNEGLSHWAQSVLSNERRQTLDKLMGSVVDLPTGVLDPDAHDEDIVIGLLGLDGRIFTKDGWIEDDQDRRSTIALDEETVAYTASAFADGADGVVLRMWFPLAVIGAAEPGTALDVLRVSPGPKIERRNAGVWEDDPGWIKILRSPKPPPVVELDADMTASVLAQVDEATAKEEFTPIDVNKVLNSSGWLSESLHHADEAGVLFTILAAKGAGNITHPVATEQLRQYWTRGKGALKIRWGTPGSWTRCHRHLSKYLGPRAAGYCTNLCQRLGGYGVACHVGD
jgi:hypothetical protein